MKIKTNILKDVLNKASKGASCNKMLPLTSLVELKCEDGVFTAVTTDGNNYLEVKNEAEGDLYAVVDISLITSLIDKTNSVDIEMTKNDNLLNVKGNGTYKINLPVDESGNPIKFSSNWNIDVVYTSSIAEEYYKKIIKSNSSSLSISLAEPCYTGYYVADRILTTDSFKICCNNIKVFDKAVLLYSGTLSLMDICSGDVEIGVLDNKIKYHANDITVVGNLMSGIEHFNADTINKLVDMKFEGSAFVDRRSLLNAIDRVLLFVSPFDKNNINLHFTKEGLELSSMQTTGNELLRYTFETEIKDFSCSIDVETLKKQIASQSGNDVQFEYGSDNAVKMIDGITTQVVALSVE